MDTEQVEQLSQKLGRQKAHDPQSRAFPLGAVIDRSTWHDKSIRIYDPTPNPNQVIGNCTMCAKAMQLNSVGNRKVGRVLNMDWATRSYEIVTSIDEFEGAWPPDDTGSSGLASCKAAQQLEVGDAYFWEFSGADGVVANIMAGRTISMGTWWDWNMFDQDAEGRVHPGGGQAGGHQYVAHGYWKSKDWIKCRCWWGGFRDFWIARTDLDDKLRDGGDAHFQVTR